MPMRIACGVVSCCLLTLWPAASAVAEEGEANLIAVMEEYFVYPEKAKEFEGYMKEAVAAAEAYGLSFGWSVYALDDLRYLSMVWVRGLAGIEEMQAEWTEVEEKWGAEAGADRPRKSYTTMSHWRSSVWSPRPDLSHLPENQADEFKYIVWGLLPVKLGHQEAVEELFNEYVKLFAEHEVPHAWRAAEVLIGGEYPTLAFVEWAASPGSYWIRHDKAMENEELSKKTEALWQKMLPHIRGFEWAAGWYLKDLSYRPEQKEEVGENSE
jgi:hypothetical protein